ncbi:uncharacterized protein [Amphiura filiformis]|uniref:uncharacterized protein n=1 Tax=Amphiura filiformis TaxID=82378 RepID=UPI003B219FE5
MGLMAEEQRERQGHDKLFIFLSGFIVIEFGFTMAINALAGGGGVKLGWFLNSTGDISDYYFLEITPIGWTFAIWGIIYTWQVLWILYVLIAICRKNKFGPVYLNPPVVTSFFLAMFTLDLAANVAWLFLWDRQLMPVALVIIFLYACTMYIMLISNHRQVDHYLPALTKYHKWDLFFNRALIQNGVAFNATWVSIATLLNVGIVISYWGGVNQSIACTVSLSILTCEVLCYFILENFILERYLRYTYSVWPVVIWALIGSIAQNWDATKTNSIFTAVLLALSSALYIVKIGLSIWRSIKRPLVVGKY